MIITILFIILFGVTNAWSEEVTVERADYAEYQKPIATLKGDVAVKYDGQQLYAREIIIDTERGKVAATGSVKLIDFSKTIECSHLDYSLREKQGEAEDIYIDAGKLFFRARQASIGTTAVILKHGVVTGCSLKKPHYGIYASRLSLYPGDRVVVKNIVFKIGSVPLFYFPYYSQSLKDNRPPLELIPSYMDTDGRILKSTFNYLLSEGSKGSFALDYVEKRGIGSGFSHTVRNKNNQGDLSFYYIKEDQGRTYLLHQKRWLNQVNYLYQKADINTMIHIDALSDPFVKRDYRSGQLILEPLSYLTITKVRANYLFRLTNAEKYSWQNNDFVKTAEYIPLLKCETRLNRWKNTPWLYTFSSTVQRNNIAGDIALETRAAGMRDYRLTNTTNLTHSVMLGGDKKYHLWEEEHLNLRQRIRNANLNLGYTVKNSSDELIAHRLDVELFRIIQNNHLRLWTGIDLLKRKQLGTDTTRVSPVNGLWKNGPASVQLGFNLNQGKIETVEGNFNLHNRLFSANLGTAYLKDTTWEATTNCLLKINPKTSFQFDTYYDIKNSHVNEANYSIKRDLHCWEAIIGFKSQPYVKNREYWIRICPK
ncbi:MAG: hypothetical protein ABH886_01295 [Candidatus Desantisbacteria bacterium]